MKHCMGILIAATLAMSALQGCASSPTETGRGISSSGQMTLSGAIEATEITLASEVGGRIIQVGAQEGETVAAGRLLVKLDDRLLLEQREQARAAVKEAEGALGVAESQLALALAGAQRGQVAAARGAVAAADAGVRLAESLVQIAEGRREAVRAELAAAQARQAAARAGYQAAEAELAMAQAAQAKGEAGATPEEIAIAERNVERAKNELWGQQNVRDAVCGQPEAVFGATCDLAQARVQAAEEVVTIAEIDLWRTREGLREEDLAALAAQTAAARAGVAAARAQVDMAVAQAAAAQAALTIAEADIDSALAQVAAAQAQREQAQAALDLLLEGARPEEIAMLEAGVARAQAALLNAQSLERASDIQLERLSLRAPIHGEVLHSLAHVGELAAPGAPLMVLADLRRLTLTVYVPQPDLGRISLNQEVEVAVDAYPDTFVGHVARIASRAEYTPRTVETREERVNMVFAIKIMLDNTDGRLKPGMPADATFRQ